jgi:hypothetical protein
VGCDVLYRPEEVYWRYEEKYIWTPAGVTVQARHLVSPPEFLEKGQNSKKVRKKEIF